MCVLELNNLHAEAAEAGKPNSALYAFIMAGNIRLSGCT